MIELGSLTHLLVGEFAAVRASWYVVAFEVCDDCGAVDVPVSCELCDGMTSEVVSDQLKYVVGV